MRNETFFCVHTCIVYLESYSDIYFMALLSRRNKAVWLVTLLKKLIWNAIWEQNGDIGWTITSFII